MNIQNTLIDNSSDNLSMCAVLKTCLATEGLQSVKIATGFWDIPGLALIATELRHFLEQEGTTLQLLIGREPLVYANVVTTPILQADFPEEYMKRDLEELDVREEYKNVVSLLFTYLQNGKWQIRFFDKDEKQNPQFLHAKCYIFNGERKNEGRFAYGIVGSSNLTEKGLRNSNKQKGNHELNSIESQYQVVNFTDNKGGFFKGHNQWFDEIWEISEPWNKKYLEQVLKPSKIGIAVASHNEPALEKLTPYETYIRLILDKFGVLVDADIKNKLKTYLPPEINMYEYQLDAAQLCYHTMHLHGGFMLGDVVGLGKTIIGLLLIKYYLDHAEEEKRDKKVLIIVPPAIKTSWINTIKTFDNASLDKMRPFVDFVTTGSIDKTFAEEDEEEAVGKFSSELKQEMYGLIIIDESHNFRNDSTQMYEALIELIDNIGATKGYYPYIGLLSATPQNNSPEDLRNQIYLFERTPRESSIHVEGRNLEAFFSNAQKRYKEIITQHPINEAGKRANRAALRFLMKEIHNKVLAEILIRRTPADIRDGYKENIHFPDVVGPVTLEYKLGYKLANLFNDTMDMIAPTEEVKEQMKPDEFIHYFRYSATKYLATEDLKKPYKGRNMNPDKSSEALARIMQILLVKRLESSFSAFKQSLRNLQRYTENMITMWEKDTIFICPQLDVNAELNLAKKRQIHGEDYTMEDCFEDIRKKITRLDAMHRNDKKQNAEYRRADFDPTYIDLLHQDKALIDELVERWTAEHRDPKLQEFKSKLNSVLFDSSKNEPQKLVIFSEAIDTVQELAAIAEKEGHSPLLITAANRDEKEDIIRANFDANYNDTPCDDYDIIITTEVLAEGVNLHRANTVLNYDTPWNSTRLIQRIGRVNRIGSTSKYVYVYNFYPSAEGDQEINLVQRAFTKLQSFHILFGEDNKVFSEEEELEKIDYKKLIDEELSEYTPYILELKEYKKQHPVRLEQIRQYSQPAIIAFKSDNKGTACVVKSEGNATGQYVILDEEGNGKIVSAIEVFEVAKCTPETLGVAFPDFETVSEKAIRTYNVYRDKLFKASGRKTVLIDAQRIIRNWLQDKKYNFDAESKNLLSLAKQLISKNNFPIAKKIVKLKEQLDDSGHLFEATTPNKLIQNELEKIQKLQAEKEGEPYIYSAIQRM